MKKIENRKVLIIPDIHQNLKFANICLDNYANQVDFVVFLGDYFDCFEEIDNINYFSVKKTCEWLNKKLIEFLNKAIFLTGNHDISYLASYVPNSYSIDKMGAEYYSCSGWTKSKARDFNKYIDPEFVKNLELCCWSNGFVLSHAGFHYNHFQPYLSEIQNVEKIYSKWEESKQTFKHEAFHWIKEAGTCRGGYHNVGSPVWLDWNMEFVDIPELPQVVGHTCCFDKPKQNGGSYCLDVYRSYCGILHPCGELEFIKVL